MYDLAIIGLGPAGLEAANRALLNNLKVVAFEFNEPGGTCLNVGCVPTKSILHCAKLFSEIKKSSALGINVAGNIEFDWKKIIERKNNIVSKFTKVLNTDLSKKLTLIKAKAELILTSEGVKIIAENSKYEAKNIIIATGSVPFELPGLTFDSKFILNSDDILKLDKLPENITVIGSGAIGAEWANIFSLFGVNVTIIEKAPALAPLFDIEIQKRTERILKLNKVKIFKNDFVVSHSGNKLTLNSGNIIETDCVLSAVGRRPLLPDITLEDGTKRKIEKKSDYETEFDNVFLAGDCFGELLLAHNASFEARNIMNKILFNKKPYRTLIPKVMYLVPEIASIGINEQEIDDKTGYIVKKTLLGSIAKSWCDEAPDGFIKLIIKDNLIKGAHLAMPEAGGLAAFLGYLIENKVEIDKISDFVFPHPSYSEIIAEALK